MLRTLTILLLAVSTAGCDQRGETSPADSQSVEETQTVQGPYYGTWGVDMTGIDDTVHPGDDFYSYVNGTWFEKNEIPAERSGWGVGYIVHETAQERVKAIIEELGAQSGKKGTPEQKVGDYYASWMDTETLNKLGITPLQPDLDRVAAIQNADDLAAEFGRQYYVYGSSPFSAGLGINPIDPNRYNINIGLTGLGLPDRDYYLEDTEQFNLIREEYVKYIANMLSLADFDDVDQRAADILVLETKIAKLQWVRADRRDRDKTYNLSSVVDLKKNHPGFNWTAFLESHNMSFLQEVNLNHPDTIDPLINLVNTESVDTWKDYLSFHLISQNGSSLSEEIDQANFDFWGKIVRGQEEQLTRWKRGVSRVGSKYGLGELIGQLYVKRHFEDTSKAMMLEMVENMRTAYGERVRELEWMGDATKQEALTKLEAFQAKIGYPDKWMDLTAIDIEKDDLLGNVRRIRKFFEDRDVKRVTQPTDKDEWFMMPQTVNAYYIPSFNQIVFPAAILDAPYFDPAADPAVNYGAIGSTIGHEMGHGFDDQGSKSDAGGVKRNWWTDEDRANFEARTEKLGEQYSSYEAVPGSFIDGRFTMGENIGDLGGLEVAYQAYKLSLNGEEAPIIDGLTGDQRFFLAYGQNWRTKRRDDYTLQLLKSSPHSPPKFRVNGVVRNMDAWYDAFNITEEHELYLPPEERVSIW